MEQSRNGRKLLQQNDSAGKEKKQPQASDQKRLYSKIHAKPWEWMFQQETASKEGRESSLTTEGSWRLIGSVAAVQGLSLLCRRTATILPSLFKVTSYTRISQVPNSFASDCPNGPRS